MSKEPFKYKGPYKYPAGRDNDVLTVINKTSTAKQVDAALARLCKGLDEDIVFLLERAYERQPRKVTRQPIWHVKALWRVGQQAFKKARAHEKVPKDIGGKLFAKAWDLVRARLSDADKWRLDNMGAEFEKARAARDGVVRADRSVKFELQDEFENEYAIMRAEGQRHAASRRKADERSRDIRARTKRYA